MRRSERLRALGELARMAHESATPRRIAAGRVLVKPETKPRPAPSSQAARRRVARLDRVGQLLEFRASPVAEWRASAGGVVDAVFSCSRRREEARRDDNAVRDAEVRADADLLRQVLLNLCLNAVQAQDDVRRRPRVRDALRDRVFLDGGPRPGVAPDLPSACSST